jgi:hypothetical protein
MSVVFYAIVARSGWQMQGGKREKGRGKRKQKTWAAKTYRLLFRMFDSRLLGYVFVLGEAVADVGGDALLNDVSEEAGERGCDGDQKPQESRDRYAGYGDGFKRDGYDVGLVEMETYRADVGDNFEPVNDNRGEQEGGDRKRADDDEKNVNSTGYVLTATAMGAVGEVLIVVLTHGWGETRDVVTPAGEDIANHLIDAGS